MKYLMQRGDRYYYYRKVPLPYRPYESRQYIRLSLFTDSKTEAASLAFHENEKHEARWKELIKTGTTAEQFCYENTVARSRLLGFNYSPIKEVALAPLEELLTRLLFIAENKHLESVAEAVIGKYEAPSVRISEALERFWEYSKDKFLNKSPNQIRKWKNPRRRAVENFISCVGNKPVGEITRDDVLKFRNWWIERIDSENMVTNSANKNFMHLKAIVESANDNLKLNLDVEHLFKKIFLEEDKDDRRLPFETDYIRNVLLNQNNLEGLNEQAQGVLYVIAELGVGLTEQVNLGKEQIVLDAEIPYINIVALKKKGLKTKYRSRKIPLVGHALDVFKKFPNGFTDYKDNPDTLSATLSKYLASRDLFPTELHSVYSLRHSFQDRLTAVDAPDRVQADLMGHKFEREKYGLGSSLEKKLEWLTKIQLKCINREEIT